jgi:hypothetical protein
MAAHAKLAAENKAEWLRVSWDNGAANPNILRELRVRADAYEAIIATTYDGYLEANDGESGD